MPLPVLQAPNTMPNDIAASVSGLRCPHYSLRFLTFRTVQTVYEEQVHIHVPLIRAELVGVSLLQPLLLLTYLFYDRFDIEAGVFPCASQHSEYFAAPNPFIVTGITIQPKSLLRFVLCYLSSIGNQKAALIRECYEELGITLRVGTLFTEVIHEYPDLTVRLSLFNAVIERGVPQKLEHNDIQWISVDETGNFEFCPADKPIIEKLISELLH